MKASRIMLVLVGLFLNNHVIAQSVPSGKVVSMDDLSNYLKSEVKQILDKDGEISTSELAEYFREKFAERYFYNSENIEVTGDQKNNIDNLWNLDPKLKEDSFMLQDNSPLKGKGTDGLDLGIISK